MSTNYRVLVRNDSQQCISLLKKKRDEGENGGDFGGELLEEHKDPFFDEFQLVVPETARRAEADLSGFTVPCHLSPEISAVDMEIRWFKEMDCVCLYKNRHMIEGKSYKGNVRQFTDVLEKGDVSLSLTRFRESDVGDYVCQQINRTWNEEERLEMEDSTLMAEKLLTVRDTQIKDLEKSKETALEDKDRLLHNSNDKLQQTTTKAEEKQREIEEKNKLMSEKETLLENTVKELETSKHQLETLKNELQQVKLEPDEPASRKAYYKHSWRRTNK
ncbi:hypothetical protein E1301_Tti008905 [Triplophysa tibetana]|uniref:Ig-like domain-containing protein n=1 Tax=Triplophysa tibetana TaxID=1572043 RepID=A0A5A9P447_9TELE|nr:hypothetical protein E1301_Tti008905 [Triplophysa tibetana]